MENSDQDAAEPPSETPAAKSGKTDPSLRNGPFDDALERAGLKRADIARLVGVSSSTVYRWGRTLPAPKVVIGFLRLYEAWAVEEDLLHKAIELLDGAGTRQQVARTLRNVMELRNNTESFLSEMK